MSNGELNLWVLTERLVKQEIRKSLLREGTLNLGEDVDYIFENGGFKQFYDDVKMGRLPDKREILRGEEIWFKNLNSSELPSETAKKAHTINPVTIRCGISFYESPEYLPYSNKINIYIHGDYFRYFYEEIPKENFNQDFFKRYMSYINSPSQLKGTIYHELSHWIRDSLNNRHIKKHLGKVLPDKIKPTDYPPEIYAKKVQKIFDMGKPDSYMTNVEIDAIIHDIIQKKRDTEPDRWNEMTMTDLIEEIGVINSTYKRVSKKYKEYIDGNGVQVKPSWKKDWAKEFVKMLLKRMSREGLVGNNMKYLK